MKPIGTDRGNSKIAIIIAIQAMLMVRQGKSNDEIKMMVNHLSNNNETV